MSYGASNLQTPDFRSSPIANELIFMSVKDEAQSKGEGWRSCDSGMKASYQANQIS